MSSEKALRALNEAGLGIDDAIKALLKRHRSDSSARMYDMLGYFLGFLDEDLKPIEHGTTGKRFRPSLCLLIAQGYGARDEALDAAIAIELFHNFTLIHDDVEDRDEYRRNRPTLWKLFGVNHAINAGDALSLVASEVAAKTKSTVSERLFSAFKEVVEGQYMDFELASQPLGSESVNIARYMESIEKKTGALLGVSAEVAEMSAGQNETESDTLRAFGRSLGIAWQLADDYRSIWSSQDETGKDCHSDIREHKRTLPFFFACEETSEKKRLEQLYSLDRQLSEKEISEALTLIDATSARVRVLQEIRTHAQRARSAAATLILPKDLRETLAPIVYALIPESIESPT